jgi:UDP-glucose 4-epimerase
MDKILLTGSSGFVGRHLGAHLKENTSFFIISTPRQCKKFSAIDWKPSLEQCTTVIHLAARTHIRHETAYDPLSVFRDMNVAGTLNLAQQAAEQGVKRFIFLSSIKVNGEGTESNHQYAAEDSVTPMNFYAQSKWEAEEGLWSIANKTGMEIVIIRPVLIYGPNVKGNLHRLLYWLKKGIPFPVASIQNQRSLLAIDNLVDFITKCISHPNAANQTFLLSDGKDWSTPELFYKLSYLLQKKALFWPFPVRLLQCLGTLTGKAEQIQRLCGSLQVDIQKACTLLDWQPKAQPEGVMAKMVEAFLLKDSTERR